VATRPSAPLLKLILEAARKKGWNTATLATSAGIDRSRLKVVLSGREPLTVDELILLSNAMELAPADLVGLETPEDKPRLAPLSAPTHSPPDPFGNHAEQALRLGFALGCDIFLTLTTDMLDGSGVPISVIKRFAPTLPIRLESAYHRHNDPQYFPQGVQLRLSFDAIYTCLFPWSAIQQITFYPAPPPEPEPDSEEPEEDSDSEPDNVVRLRLV
jgi:lambda repressor-like predicted transcriptional regulator